MKLNEVFSSLKENDVKGKKVDKAYDALYHLTDFKGFTHTLANDSLMALRYSYVSLTYGEYVRAVGGRDHYHFRFVIDGRALLADYEGYYYQSWARTNDGSKHWYDEMEIGVQTKEISPFSKYCTGFEILVPVFSRSFIQWLFYKTEGIRGIEAISRIKNQWNVQLYSHHSDKRKLTSEEIEFLNYCIKIRDLPFDDALAHLVEKFDNIADHFGIKLDSKMLSNEKYLPAQVEKINDLIAQKKFEDIDEGALKKLVIETINYIDPDHAADVINDLSSKNLFTRYLPPIAWSILFKEISKDKEYSYTEEMEKEAKKVEGFYKQDDNVFAAYMKHTRAGT